MSTVVFLETARLRPPAPRDEDAVMAVSLSHHARARLGWHGSVRHIAPATARHIAPAQHLRTVFDPRIRVPKPDGPCLPFRPPEPGAAA